jgi:phosphoribosylglycinamide formyltransferase-1
VRHETDSGPILAQAAVPVLPGDTADRLAARVLEAEHRIYPLALRLIGEGRARVVEERVEIVALAGGKATPGALLNPPQDA